MKVWIVVCDEYEKCCNFCCASVEAVFATKEGADRYIESQYEPDRFSKYEEIVKP